MPSKGRKKKIPDRLDPYRYMMPKPVMASVMVIDGMTPIFSAMIPQINFPKAPPMKSKGQSQAGRFHGHALADEQEWQKSNQCGAHSRIDKPDGGQCEKCFFVFDTPPV